jgi:hypothetical protein
MGVVREWQAERVPDCARRRIARDHNVGQIQNAVVAPEKYLPLESQAFGELLAQFEQVESFAALPA